MASVADQPSDPRPTHVSKGAPYAFLLSLLLIAGFEAWVRTRPAAVLGAYREEVDHATAVRNAADANGSVDVALVGSSMMHQGVLISEFESQLSSQLGRPVTARNYAIRGGQADLFDATVQFLLRQPRKPRVIVVGISMRDLRQRREDAQVDRMAEFWTLKEFFNEWGKQDRSRMVEALPVVARNHIGSVLKTLHYRTGLALWFKQHFIDAPAEPSPALGDVPARLQGSRGEQSLADPKELAAFSRPTNKRRMIQTYRPELPARPAIRMRDRVQSIIQSCQRENVTLLFVEMPIAPALSDLINTAQRKTRTKDASRDFDPEFRRTMFRLIDGTGVPFLVMHDLDLELWNGDFHDGQHLNRKGAEKMTAALAREIAKAGRLK